MMRRILIVVALLAAARVAGAAQLTDSTYVPHVTRPAYTDPRPIVLLDAGHANPFPADGRAHPFVQLLEADGYRVMPSPQPFSEPLLSRARVLVVVNALNHIGDRVYTSLPAFSQDEARVLLNWIEAGGAMLFVAEPTPFANAAAGLAKNFGITFGERAVTDSAHREPRTVNAGSLLFSRDNGLLGDHAITRGRDATETVRQVATWTGVAVTGPPGASSLLTLGPGARELGDDGAARAGDAQAIAFTRGHGRIVVMGDAALLTAQLVTGEEAGAHGATLALGINRTDLDDGQFVLNVMHWLSGALDPPPRPVVKPRPKVQRSRTSGRVTAREPSAKRTQ
jgi:uncharacterized protein DUF4350